VRRISGIGGKLPKSPVALIDTGISVTAQFTDSRPR